MATQVCAKQQSVAELTHGSQPNDKTLAGGISASRYLYSASMEADHAIDEDLERASPLLYVVSRHLVLLHHVLFRQRRHNDACNLNGLSSILTFCKEMIRA